MSHRASDLLKLSALDSEVGVVSAAELDDTTAASDVGRTGDVLLYGLKNSPQHRALLEDITGVAFAGVSPVTTTSSELSWTAEAAALAPELVGMQLNLHLPASFFSSFDLQGVNAGKAETLALVGGQPWFLRVKAGERWVYVLGIDQIPDADMAVTSAEQELPLVSAAIAILLFVRRHFPAHAWFARESFGNFVIDDPLLRPSYGFVQHEQLAAQVTQSNGAATIAFIPWNAHRSAARTAALYKRTSNLSICVHGYEHIDNEFSTSDVEDLCWRAERAMDAMRIHHDLTGVGFEPVMVFPQGKFSSGAIGALARAGFLAAANSTFLATDARGVVRLKDLLEPAVTAYGSVPLFRRRAPQYVNRFRYDLIIGKPLLLVAHHEYFRDQGEAFRQVLNQVRAMAPRARWVPLGEIARTVHLVRTPRQGHAEVRFYCRQFRFRVTESARYAFTKREDPADVQAVRVNGVPVDFDFNHDTLRFYANLERSDRDVEVVVQSRQHASAPRPSRGRSTRLAVAARRYVSEGRDNYIATNSQMRSCWTRARRFLKG